MNRTERLPTSDPRRALIRVLDDGWEPLELQAPGLPPAVVGLFGRAGERAFLLRDRQSGRFYLEASGRGEAR